MKFLKHMCAIGVFAALSGGVQAEGTLLETGLPQESEQQTLLAALQGMGYKDWVEQGGAAILSPVKDADVKRKKETGAEETVLKDVLSQFQVSAMQDVESASLLNIVQFPSVARVNGSERFLDDYRPERKDPVSGVVLSRIGGLSTEAQKKDGIEECRTGASASLATALGNLLAGGMPVNYLLLAGQENNQLKPIVVRWSNPAQHKPQNAGLKWNGKVVGVLAQTDDKQELPLALADALTHVMQADGVLTGLDVEQVLSHREAKKSEYEGLIANMDAVRERVNAVRERVKSAQAPSGHTYPEGATVL